jgi:hypothetical protein
MIVYEYLVHSSQHTPHLGNQAQGIFCVASAIFRRVVPCGNWCTEQWQPKVVVGIFYLVRFHKVCWSFPSEAIGVLTSSKRRVACFVFWSLGAGAAVNAVRIATAASQCELEHTVDCKRSVHMGKAAKYMKVKYAWWCGVRSIALWAWSVNCGVLESFLCLSG